MILNVSYVIYCLQNKREKMDALVRKLTECPICMEKLANPKYLPCHHTFCCRCIETLCTDFNGRSCPLCRSAFDAPEDGRCTRLPTNVFAEQLVRVNRVVAETRMNLNELAQEKQRLQSQVLELERSLSYSETEREHAETRAESYQEAKTDAEASLAKEKQLCQDLRQQLQLTQRQSEEVKNEPKETRDVKGTYDRAFLTVPYSELFIRCTIIAKLTQPRPTQ